MRLAAFDPRRAPAADLASRGAPACRRRFLTVGLALLLAAGCRDIAVIETSTAPSGDGEASTTVQSVRYERRYAGPTITDVLEGLAATMKLIAQVATVLVLVDRLVDS